MTAPNDERPDRPTPAPSPPPRFDDHPAPAPGYQAPPQGYPLVRKTNGMAIASLVLGLVWMAGTGSLLAVIFGHIARRQVRESRGTQTGSTMALWGLILGYIGLVGVLLWIIITVAAIGSAAA